jgi:hypothetical protein
VVFSSTPVSSINKIDCYDITDYLILVQDIDNWILFSVTRDFQYFSGVLPILHYLQAVLFLKIRTVFVNILCKDQEVRITILSGQKNLVLTKRHGYPVKPFFNKSSLKRTWSLLNDMGTLWNLFFNKSSLLNFLKPRGPVVITFYRPTRNFTSPTIFDLFVREIR